MKVRVYDSFRNNRLASEWKSIVNRYGYFVQNSYEWCEMWWRHFSNNKRHLHIVTVRDNQRIVAISPMFLENRKFFTLLRFVGSPLTDFHQFIIVKDHRYKAVFNLLLEHFRKFTGWDVVLVEQINNESREYRLLDGKLKKKFVIECPIIDFQGYDWDGYIANIKSRNLRHDFKKKNRRLNRDFIVDFKRINTNNDFLKYFDDIINMHIVRWEQDNEDSKFKSEKISSFIRNVFASLMKQEKAALWILKINDGMIAYRLGFIQNQVFYDWNTSFSSEYKSYSPGKLITGYVIRDLIDMRYKRFHYMRGGYFYKKAWMPKDRQHISENYLFVINKPDLKGWFLKYYYLKMRDIMKTVLGDMLRRKAFRRILKLSSNQNLITLATKIR